MAENRPGGFIEPKERMINALERIARALEANFPLKIHWPDVGVEYPINKRANEVPIIPEVKLPVKPVSPPKSRRKRVNAK